MAASAAGRRDSCFVVEDFSPSPSSSSLPVTESDSSHVLSDATNGQLDASLILLEDTTDMVVSMNLQGRISARMPDSPLDRLPQMVKERRRKEAEKVAAFHTKREVERAHSQYLKQQTVSTEESLEAKRAVDAWVKKHSVKVVDKVQRRNDSGRVQVKAKRNSRASQQNSASTREQILTNSSLAREGSSMSRDIHVGYVLPQPSREGNLTSRVNIVTDFEPSPGTSRTSATEAVSPTIDTEDTNQRGASVERFHCHILNCQAYFTDKALYEHHVQEVEHNPCNPCLHVENMELRNAACSMYICPICHKLCTNYKACNEHMLESGHRHLWEPLRIAGFACPQCLMMYRDRLACLEHIQENSHQQYAYPFADDGLANVVPVAIPQYLYEQFHDRCRQQPWHLECVDCEQMITKATATLHNRQHFVTAITNSNLIDVFATFLKSYTCVQCLRMFSEDEILDTEIGGTHQCNADTVGLIIESDCQSFQEFVLRSSLIAWQPNTHSDAVGPTEATAVSHHQRYTELDASVSVEPDKQEKEKRAGTTWDKGCYVYENEDVDTSTGSSDINEASFAHSFVKKCDLVSPSESITKITVGGSKTPNETGASDDSSTVNRCRQSGGSSCSSDTSIPYVDISASPAFPVKHRKENKLVSNPKRAKKHKIDMSATRGRKRLKEDHSLQQGKQPHVQLDQAFGDEDHCSSPEIIDICSMSDNTARKQKKSSKVQRRKTRPKKPGPPSGANFRKGRYKNACDVSCMEKTASKSADGKGGQEALFTDTAADYVQTSGGVSQCSSMSAGTSHPASRNNWQDPDSVPLFMSETYSASTSSGVRPRTKSPFRFTQAWPPSSLVGNEQPKTALDAVSKAFTNDQSTRLRDRTQQGCESLDNGLSSSVCGQAPVPPFTLQLAASGATSQLVSGIESATKGIKGQSLMGVSSAPCSVPPPVRPLDQSSAPSCRGRSGPCRVAPSLSKYKIPKKAVAVPQNSYPGTQRGTTKSNVSSANESPGNKLPENLDTVSHIIFLDLDNWGGFFSRLPEALPDNTFVWAFYGGNKEWKEPLGCRAYLQCKRSKMFYLHKKCGRTKDAADFALVMHVGRMDERLPKHIPFTILSGDRGFCEVEKQMELSERRTVVINPHHKTEVMVFALIKSVGEA